MAQTVHQPNRVNKKGANDRWIKAFIVENQNRVVKTRPRIHHESTWARRTGDIAEVGRDEPLPMHPRHIQVRKSGHRSTAAVRGKTRDRRALEQEGQQFRLRKDPRDQLAILQVVARESGLVFIEAPLDFVHSLVWIIDGLAFAEHGLRDILEAERREAPCCRPKRFNAIDQQSTRRAREEMVLSETMLPPFHYAPAATQPQRNLI